jgi:hypothetical protein
MRSTRVKNALLVSIVALTGCGVSASPSDGGAAAGTQTRSTAPPANDSPASSGTLAEARIPEGTWAKVSTLKDATRMGLPDQVAQRLVGADGVLHVELRIDGQDFAQFGDDQKDDELVLGDRGTATYDPEGHWVLTSQSEGCRDCVSSFTWSVHDDRLTLALRDVAQAGDPVDQLVGRFVMEGTYTRTVAR